METFYAEFESIDAAEYGAWQLQQRLPDITISLVTPLHPKSITRQQGHQEHFTLLPTAIASPHYITALVVTESDGNELSEIDRRQTASVCITADKSRQAAIQHIVTAAGGQMQ